MKIQTENPIYIRDTNSKALLNNDMNALHKHRIEKEKNNKIDKILNILVNMEQRISKLEEENK